MYQSRPQPHHLSNHGLIVMAHYQLPDRGAKDFYEDAPRMSHSDVNAAKLPIDHIPESGCYPDHEEQEANNDQRKYQANQVLPQPEAQLSSLCEFRLKRN